MLCRLGFHSWDEMFRRRYRQCSRCGVLHERRFDPHGDPYWQELRSDGWGDW